MKLSEVGEDTNLFILGKGDPGSGKSIFAASFPKPLILDFDRKKRSVYTYFKTYDTNQFNSIEYETPDSYFRAKKILTDLQHDNPYGTVVVDSLTYYADLVLRELRDFKGSGQGRKIGPIQVTDIGDFLGEDSALTETLDLLKGLKSNVIVLAHVIQTEQKDLRSGKTNYSRSLLTGGKKVAAKIPAAFDEAYHFQVDVPIEVGEEPRYEFITHHAGSDWARTSLNLPFKLDFTNDSGYRVLMEAIGEFDRSETTTPDAQVL